MSVPVEVVTPQLLRGWPLPEPGRSKHSRGGVLVIGGARGTPGAVLLAGVAALRVGAGVLALAVAESVAAAVAVAVPEAGVTGLTETPGGSVAATAADLLAGPVKGADVVLFGPGLDDPDQTRDLLAALVPMVGADTGVVIDAYGLGVLPDIGGVHQLGGRLVLTPNRAEAARLLAVDGDADLLDDPVAAAAAIADRYQGAVTFAGAVAAPDGRRWQVAAGHPGLATSGSGDVLAGAVTGLLARGADPAQATCWATQLHAAAGDRLAARVGRVGFLGRELLTELPLVLTELTA